MPKDPTDTAATISALEDLGEEFDLDVSTLAADARDFMLEQFKHRPKDWQLMTEQEQRDLAAVTEQNAERLVQKIAEAIAAAGRADPVRLLIGKVTFGEKITLTAEVKAFGEDEQEAALIALHRQHGKFALLTPASAEDYRGEGRDAETLADEPPLDFEAGDGDEMFEASEEELAGQTDRPSVQAAKVEGEKAGEDAAVAAKPKRKSQSEIAAEKRQEAGLH